jgi:hypothetical protein
MQLRLDLSRHCIQTELKRCHDRAVCDYFRASPEAQAHQAKVIETLRRALEGLDFQGLRARYPVLGGGNDTEIRLSEHGHRWRIAMGERVVYVTPRQG